MRLACQSNNPHGKIQLQISGRTMREQESMAASIAKWHHFCVQNFTPSPHCSPKIIAAPASMLIDMDGTALRNCLLDGRDRTMQEWTGPHCNAVYYGRDLAKTHITRDGTALQRCLIWTGPRRAALKRA